MTDQQQAARTASLLKYFVLWQRAMNPSSNLKSYRHLLGTAKCNLFCMSFRLQNVLVRIRCLVYLQTSSVTQPLMLLFIHTFHMFLHNTSTNISLLLNLISTLSWLLFSYLFQNNPTGDDCECVVQYWYEIRINLQKTIVIHLPFKFRINSKNNLAA